MPNFGSRGDSRETQYPDFHCYGSKFKGRVDFSGSSVAQFGLSGTEIGGDAGFHEFKTSGALFDNVVFSGSADFEHTRGDDLDFYGSLFKGRVSFLGAECGKVTFRPRHLRPSSVPFEKTAVFDGLRCDSARFDGAEFHDDASLARAEFHKAVVFYRVRFLGDVNLRWAVLPPYGSTLPPKGHSDPWRWAETGFVLHEVAFSKAVFANWDQLVEGHWWLSVGRPRLLRCDSGTWRSLEDGLGRSGNLDGQNGAKYQRRMVAYHDDPSEDKAINWVEWAYWGYAVRPARLVGWFCVIVLVFAMVYFTQTRALAHRRGWPGLWERVKFSVVFSARTALRLDYGYKNSTTRLFQALTLAESIAGKFILLCWLQAVVNLSPVLKTPWARSSPSDWCWNEAPTGVFVVTAVALD